MSQYARETSVPVAKSRDEIEWIIKRYGCGDFLYGTKGNQVVIGFVAKMANIRLTMALPPKADYERDRRGSKMAEGKVEAAYQQAIRQRWRALALVVKAKLEAVESGVATFEQEFLPYMVLPGGKTVAEELIPKMKVMYETGKVPALLLGAGEGGKG